jgi:prevent-host-death family protein
MKAKPRARKAEGAALIDVNVQHVRANWAETINRVHYLNQPFRVVRFGKPVAVILSPEEYERLTAA